MCQHLMLDDLAYDEAKDYNTVRWQLFPLNQLQLKLFFGKFLIKSFLSIFLEVIPSSSLCISSNVELGDVRISGRGIVRDGSLSNVDADESRG